MQSCSHPRVKLPQNTKDTLQHGAEGLGCLVVETRQDPSGGAQESQPAYLRLVFMVERLPDSNDSRRRRRALGTSSSHQQDGRAAVSAWWKQHSAALSPLLATTAVSPPSPTPASAQAASPSPPHSAAHHTNVPIMQHCFDVCRPTGSQNKKSSQSTRHTHVCVLDAKALQDRARHKHDLGCTHCSGSHATLPVSTAPG